ncbi:MAG: hypothetical protein AB1644_05720 [Candidatus Zixiibacteriota bacterium]
MTRIWVAAIFLGIVGGTYHSPSATDFGIKAGIGYDFLSQEYFLDSLTQAGVDSFLTGWSLKTNYLDDFRGMLELRMSSSDFRKLDLRAVYEQGSEKLRLKLYPAWRPKLGQFKLDASGELDWRNRYRGEVEPGDSYLSGTGRAKLKLPIDERFTLWVQGQGELVRFADPSAVAFDYQRFGGKLGTDLFAGLSLASLDVFYLARNVTDSGDLNYANFGLEAAWLALASRGDIDLAARLERKDYQRLDRSDDYSRLEFGGRGKLLLGSGWFGRPEIEFEANWFNAEDLVNSNYTKTTASVVAGYGFDGLEVGLGPEMEWLTMAQDSLQDGEDYLETGGKGTIDYSKLGRFFGTLDYHLGYRRLTNPSDLQTSFTYQRLNLIGDWRVVGGFNFNILLGLEWEWHTRAEDNNRLVLLSSSLTYAF